MAEQQPSGLSERDRALLREPEESPDALTRKARGERRREWLKALGRFKPITRRRRRAPYPSYPDAKEDLEEIKMRWGY